MKIIIEYVQQKIVTGKVKRKGIVADIIGKFKDMED
jgi:hypothetical protein